MSNFFKCIVFIYFICLSYDNIAQTDTLMTINPFQKNDSLKSKRIIYFIPSKLFQNHIAVAYEHIFPKNTFGIRIPVSVGFLDVRKFKPQGLYYHESDYSRQFTSGIDLNFYPTKIGKLKFMISIGLQYAQFVYKDYKGSPYHYTLKSGNHFSFLISNGFISQISKKIMVSGTIGAGFQIEPMNYSTNQTALRLNSTITIGYAL